MHQHKLEVKYHSQFLEVEDSFWNIRSCGGACLRMICDYYNLDVPSIIEIMKEAKENGGYDMKNGFIHDFAVTFLKSKGLNSYRKENIKDDHDDSLLSEVLISLRKGNPVIVSVNKEILEQKKSHLILLVGYEYDMADDIHNIKNFIYHEPEATDIERGSFRVCDIETFKKYWRAKAIFVSK